MPTVQSSLSDTQLAEIIARRERSALDLQNARQACDQLYERHGRVLLAFLAGRARRSDIEDFNQAIWERVWRCLPQSFKGNNFRAWLFTIARNYVIDQMRMKVPGPISEAAEPLAGEQDGPEAALLYRERMVVLGRCLELLDKPSAELVRGRLSGDGYDAVCDRLGLKMEAAHTLFHRAKQQLQNCVRRQLA
jgi:RNA polymerase sigma-70 factor, ECF subfamily